MKGCDLLDNIRRLEAEVVRYRQLLQTLTGDQSTMSDLDLQDSDLYQLLVKCLDGDV